MTPVQEQSARHGFPRDRTETATAQNNLKVLRFTLKRLRASCRGVGVADDLL
jgi:hypothetical protein